jgi:hypothetical protein
MMKRKAGVLGITVILLCAVSPLYAGGSGQQAGGSGKYRVAFIPGSMANESQAYSAKQFQKFGPEMGFDVTLQAPSNRRFAEPENLQFE